MHANACPFWDANRPCMNGCPSDSFYNRGPTRAPTAQRLTTNVSETIQEAQEADPTLCQAIDLVIFHPDVPAFSSRVLLRVYEWTDLPARATTAKAAPALTETATPDPTTPMAVGSGKRN